jgi:hypothetical protein
MVERVYIETSIIGAYVDNRSDVISAAQNQWTRIWWDDLRQNYELAISRAVIDELSHPDYPHSDEAMKLVSGIPELPIEKEVRQIVQVYVQQGIMPQNPLGDALHLAVASFHKCDYLLTWNCKHIANPNKFNRIRLCNATLGLFVPALVTPNQLIGDFYD